MHLDRYWQRRDPTAWDVSGNNPKCRRPRCRQGHRVSTRPDSTSSAQRSRWLTRRVRYQRMKWWLRERERRGKPAAAMQPDETREIFGRERICSWEETETGENIALQGRGLLGPCAKNARGSAIKLPAARPSWLAAAAPQQVPTTDLRPPTSRVRAPQRHRSRCSSGRDRYCRLQPD